MRLQISHETQHCCTFFSLAAESSVPYTHSVSFRGNQSTHIRTTFFTLKFSSGVTSGSWPLSFCKTICWTIRSSSSQYCTVLPLLLSEERGRKSFPLACWPQPLGLVSLLVSQKLQAEVGSTVAVWLWGNKGLISKITLLLLITEKPKRGTIIKGNKTVRCIWYWLVRLHPSWSVTSLLLFCYLAWQPFKHTQLHYYGKASCYCFLPG